MRRTAHARANTKSKKSRGPLSSSEQAGNTLDRPDPCSPLMESTARKENSPTSRSPGGGAPMASAAATAAAAQCFLPLEGIRKIEIGIN